MAALLLALLLSQERPRLVEYSEEGAARPAGASGLLDRLDEKTVRLALREATPTAAFAALAAAAGVEIRLDESLAAAASEPLSLDLRAVRASTALFLLCDLYGVTPAFGADAVEVSLPATEAEGDVPTRYYDVADLTFSLRDFPGGELALVRRAGDRLEGDENRLSADTLIDLIQSCVDPGGWEFADRSLQAHESTLIVCTTPATHREVERLLGQLRSVRDARVRTEIRVVAVDEALLATLRKDGAEIGPEGRKALDGAELLGALEVVCFNAQRVTPSTFRQNSFFGDASTLQATTEGLQADLRPVCNHDLTMVTTELRLTQTDLRKGDARAGRTSGLRTTVTAPAGALVIAGSFGYFTESDPRRAIVLLQSTTERPAAGGTGVAARTSGTLDRIVKTRAAVATAMVRSVEREATVTRALRLVAEAAGCDVILDPRLTEFDEARVELPEGELAASEFLGAVAGAYGLAWQVRDGFVMVTAAGLPEELTGMPAVVYPVADLLAELRSFPGPRLEPIVPDDDEGLSGAVVEFGDWSSGCFVDTLVDVVVQSTGGESWEMNEFANATLVNNMLVVTQVPEVHAQIGKLLEDLRSRQRRRQVRTEARVVAMGEELLRSLREAEDVEARLAEAIAGGRATLLAAGELVAHDTQRAHALLIDSETHVLGYSTDDEGRTSPRAEPVTAGWVLDVTPVTVEDGGTLKLELLYAQLGRGAVTAKETEHGTVAQPTQDYARLETSLSLPSGRTVIAGSLGSFTGGDERNPRRMVLLLRATVIGVE